MCGNGQEHHKTPLFHQICTLIRKSPWYLTFFQNCRYRPHAVWKWSILGVFYYRSWLECVAVVRSITKRHFFIKIAHPRQCQIIYHTPLWGSGRAARHDAVIASHSWTCTVSLRGTPVLKSLYELLYQLSENLLRPAAAAFCLAWLTSIEGEYDSARFVRLCWWQYLKIEYFS